MDIACSTSVVRGRPIEEGLKALRDAGFERIELTRFYMEELRGPGLPERLDLKVWAVHGSLGSGALSQDEVIRAKEVAAESERMRKAACFAPCPYVIHYLFRSHDPQEGESFGRSVRELLHVAEQTGLVLAVETVPYKPAENSRYASTKEVARFVHSLESRHAGVCVDLNHSNIHESLLSAVENCDGLIADIHVSDNHGTCEEHLAPGRGCIEYVPVLKAMLEAGYAGPLNLEVRASEITDLAQLTALRQWAENTAALAGS